MLADVPETLKPLEHLGTPDGTAADPWLDYQLSAGRDVNALLNTFWTKLAK